MKIFGREINLTIGSNKVQDVQNVDKRKPKRAGIKSKLKQVALHRIRQDISTWENANDLAKSTVYPDRTEMIRLYDDIVMDSQIDSVIRTINNKILGSAFSVVDREGNEIEELTARLENKTFHKFLRYAQEANYFGYSLVEFEDVQNDFFKDVCLIPREHVVPEKKIVKVNAYGGETQIVDLKQPAVARWSILLEGEMKFGMLNQAAPLVLFKKVALASFSEYGEIFGTPIRVINIDHYDDEEVDDAISFLEDMGRSAYGVFKKDQEFQMFGDNRTDAYEVFTQMLSYTDSQIAKIFLGTNFIKDDGGSRARDEVLNELLNDYIVAYKRFLQWQVNDQLVPVMMQHGIWQDGAKFVWDSREVLSAKDNKEILAVLLPHYDISPEEIAKKVNFEVGEKSLGQEQQEALDQLNNIAGEYGIDRPE